MNKGIVVKFDCCGKHMIVAKLEHGTHVMDAEEWYHIYRKQHLKYRDKKRNLKTA